MCSSRSARTAAVRVGVARRRGLRWHPHALRVDVLDARVESVAAQDAQDPVLGDVLEEDLDTLQLDPLVEHRGQLAGRFVGDATCTPVGDVAVVVERGQVAAGRDVAGSQVELDPRRRQDPATELVLLWVVAEQGEVAGAGPDGHPGHQRIQQPHRALRRQPVEVRRARLLQLGVELAVGVAAEAVEHEQQDLARILVEDLGQLEHVTRLGRRCRHRRQRPTTTPSRCVPGCCPWQVSDVASTTRGCGQ